MEDSKYDALKDSALYNSTTKIEEAKRFLANVVWTYEEVRERGTAPKDGKHNRITMRRFAPGAPGGCVREVLDLLTQQAPYADPVISNMVFPGKWRPKYSWFRKDSRYETVNYKTHTVTLIQDLVPADDNGEVENINGGGNCSQIEEFQYVWDAAEVTSPEPPYPQGVTYSVQGVNRDDESGLFNYVIRKTVAVMQHTSPYVSAKTATSTRVTESWSNLYDSDLAELDLPEEGTNLETGEAVTVERRKNPDCTWDIAVHRTKTTPNEAAEQCKKVLTQHEHSTSKGGQTAPLGEAPAAKGGVHYEYASKLEEDGTYTNTVGKTTEINVNGHTVQRRGTLYGVQKTVTDVNTTSNPANDAVGIGESIEVTRTPGGLYNVERTCFILCVPPDLGEVRTTTIAQSSCQTKDVADEKISDEATASGGVITNYQQNLNEFGKWERCTTVITEIPVTDCTVQTEVTLRGTRVTTVDIHQPENVAQETKATCIGDSVQITKTDGGLYNVTKTSVCMADEMCTGWSGSATVFEKNYSCQTVGPEKLSCLGKGINSIEVACNGVIKSASSSLTELGAYENSETEKQEISVPCAVVQVETTAFGKNTTVIHQNQATCRSSDQAGVTIRNDLTDGGLYDVTVTCVCREETEWVYGAAHTHFLDQTRTEVQGATNKPADLTGDTYGSMSVALCDDGKYDYTKVVACPIARSWEGRGEAYGNGMTVTVNEHKNADEVETTPASEQGVIYRNSKELNEYGKYDIEYTTQKAGCFWEHTITLPQDNGISYLYFYENAPTPRVPEYSGTVSHATASVSRDQFGLFSGSVTVTFRPDKDDPSSGGGSSDDDDDDKDTSTQPGGTCNTLGRTTIAAWSIKDKVVKSTTTEFYNGIAYDVTWSAKYHAGFITDGTTATFEEGAHLSMPGAAPGGITPYAAGAFYSYYTEVKRESVAKAADGTVDENGAPVVSSGSGS